MQYKTLKNTDLNLSTHIMGTDNFGSGLTIEQSSLLMDRYFELGGNVLDTARLYGCWVEGKDGASEETIGAYLHERKCRNHVIISTKCAHHDLATNKKRLSREEIRFDVEKSLNVLKINEIDLLWLHRDDTSRYVEEIIDTLDELVREGKVRYIGTSNWRAARIQEANAYAKKCGKASFCASQVQMSLAQENPESAANDPTIVHMDDEEYTFFRVQNFPIFAFSSQGNGFFKKMDEGGVDQLIGKSNNRYYNEANLEYYKRAKKLAEGKDVSITAVILSYLLSLPSDVFPILGCKNIPQLDDSMKDCDLRLSNLELNFILGK